MMTESPGFAFLPHAQHKEKEKRSETRVRAHSIKKQIHIDGSYSSSLCCPLVLLQPSKQKLLLLVLRTLSCIHS